MDIGNLLMSRRSATNDVDAEVLREVPSKAEIE